MPLTRGRHCQKQSSSIETVSAIASIQWFVTEKYRPFDVLASRLREKLTNLIINLSLHSLSLVRDTTYVSILQTRKTRTKAIFE